MLFSSHRFGNLTRHADLILFVIFYLIFLGQSVNDVWCGGRYMNDSVVVEEGTHDQLIMCSGEYARIWTLQAQAFL